MTQSKHTPGPWVAVKNLHEKRGIGSWFVGPANAHHGYLFESCTPDLIANEANAQLIAAAPDLLNALETLAKMDVKGHSLLSRLQFSDEGREILKTVQSAIAKAKGEE